MLNDANSPFAFVLMTILFGLIDFLPAVYTCNLVRSFSNLMTISGQNDSIPMFLRKFGKEEPVFLLHMSLISTMSQTLILCRKLGIGYQKTALSSLTIQGMIF